MLCQELYIILMTYLIKLWSMVVHDLMFGYKHAEILLENVAEIWWSFWYTAGLITDYMQLGLWSASTVRWLMNINIWETQFWVID